MSVRPMEIPSQELERETLTMKPRSDCGSEFAGTICSVLVSVPALLWVFFIVHRIGEKSGPFCEFLLKQEDPFASALFAMLFIFFVLILQLFQQLFQLNRPGHLKNPTAAAGLFLVVCAGIAVFSGFPNLEGKTTFGLFRNSSWVTQNNNSEYWNNNIKTCECKNEACEDRVYREYLIQLYGLQYLEGFEISSYTKLDEIKKPGGLAQGLNGTSSKNGDSSSPSSNSSYHRICYFGSSGDEGNKTLCYKCYACEEKYLRDVQRECWRFGNELSLLSLLLFVSNMIVFLAECWARYMG